MYDAVDPFAAQLNVDLHVADLEAEDVVYDDDGDDGGDGIADFHQPLDDDQEEQPAIPIKKKKLVSRTVFGFTNCFAEFRHFATSRRCWQRASRRTAILTRRSCRRSRDPSIGDC